MDVQIFMRPVEAPIFTVTGENIRIAYGEWWVDFKNGDVSVTKDCAQKPGVQADADCEQCNINKAMGANYCSHCLKQFNRTA